MKNLNQKWINVLTGGRVDKQQQFEEILATSKSEVLAIMKMRRLLMNERGKDIKLQDLLDCQIKEESYLINMLQEIFLEKIELKDIEYFYKKAIEKYGNMNEAFKRLYNRHLEDQGRRFLTVVLTL